MPNTAGTEVPDASILVRILGESVQARMDRLDGAGHAEITQSLGEHLATLAGPFGEGARRATTRSAALDGITRQHWM